MHSLLTQEHYCSQEIFDREQLKIFRRLWIFAGLRRLLDKPDDFATRNIGGVSIVLQNCGGKIKAFENQCLHRLMPLQWEDYGHRRLACRYHGWVYDHQGKPATIPSCDQMYCFATSDRENLKLREFFVAEVGQLVFVNLSEAPLALEAQFHSTYLSRLEEVSEHLDGEVIHTRIGTHYNWKLNYENVLDYNHVRYLHPRTFLPYLDETNSELSAPSLPAAIPTDGRLRDQSFEVQGPFKTVPQVWHGNVRRLGNEDCYYNFFIYPNVNFISVGGYIFLVQQFDPLSANKTDVGFSLMTAKRHRRITGSAALLWAHLRGEKQVLDEDIGALERLQRAMQKGGRRAFHGAYEHRIITAHRTYLSLMGSA